MAKDRELQDHERAHSGQPGAKARHGADATGKMYNTRPSTWPKPDEPGYDDALHNPVFGAFDPRNQRKPK